MAVLKANVPRRRSTERRGIVVLMLAVLVAAGGLIMVGQSEGGRVTAVSVSAAEAVDSADAMEPLQSNPPQPHHDSALASASACSANGISGDMIGDASPHEVYETYRAWCLGQ
jgi:hypothetical protein